MCAPVKTFDQNGYYIVYDKATRQQDVAAYDKKHGLTFSGCPDLYSNEDGRFVPYAYIMSHEAGETK